MKLDEVASHLGRFVQAHYGSTAEVDGLKVMEAGHAGLTFGFRVVERDSAHVLAQLVLKLAPPGVRRAGNTDVFRQAALLRALHATGLPVPDVPWAGDDDTWFGTPFVMMAFLPGLPFFVWQPDARFDRAPHAVAPLWEQCIDALVRLHRFDWQRHLPDWERPTALHDEITRWDRILAKAPEPVWASAGQRVRERLLECMPASPAPGLVHGDYQPGNVLYEQGRLMGVIDWELASIGSPLLDVGWLMMLADPQGWQPDWRPLCPLTPHAIAVRYGAEPEAMAWWQALAGYRLGAIACLNVHLHRSGRRPDAVWERFALAIPTMFARAAALLRDADVAREEVIR
ncbi:MAG TPA: phosphotransferase family protein [Burkholderiaceae bacterium]|nr:phosphotransferase family protein [Burkholderiaceae bacterium]